MGIFWPNVNLIFSHFDKRYNFLLRMVNDRLDCHGGIFNSLENRIIGSASLELGFAAAFGPPLCSQPSFLAEL